ncbi:MAG: hypothetical protein JSV62_11350 [Promethearchaeota archaeon]|nr:MAG: hypothetical protein JSV62_11350 [Candidatus Lokiarchaeota archaeon]
MILKEKLNLIAGILILISVIITSIIAIPVIPLVGAIPGTYFYIFMLVILIIIIHLICIILVFVSVYNKAPVYTMSGNVNIKLMIIGFSIFNLIIFLVFSYMVLFRAFPLSAITWLIGVIGFIAAGILYRNYGKS